MAEAEFEAEARVIRWPWVSRALVDHAIATERNTAAALKEQADRWHLDLIAERARFDDLLAKYHQLRSSGQAIPDPAVTQQSTSPLAALGPLTTAALREASVGLPILNRRAMDAKVLAMHASGTMSDAQIADAVRRGEATRIVG